MVLGRYLIVGTTTWEVVHIWGVLFWDPSVGYPIFWGSILGAPDVWKLPHV